MSKNVKEFPKSLYRGGRDGDHIIVEDAEQEAAQRKEGFKMLSETDKKSKAATQPDTKASGAQ